MTAVVLLTVQPKAAATGVATTIRLAGGGHCKPYFYGGDHYRAGVAALSRFKAAIGFEEEGWTGKVTPTTGTIIWAPATPAALDDLQAYVWKGAAITIQEGDEDLAVFTTRLAGKVADCAITDQQLVITVADLGADLAKPLVTGRLLGTGGIEGAAEAKGRAKRRTWGRVFNIEGRVLDKANNIYEFGDLAFPWQSFELVRDKGREASPAPVILPWQGSVLATLDALKVSLPALGTCVVAPSICCLKWWTQPAGPLTADVKGEVGAGYVETAPSIVERILGAVAGPAITNVAAANGWRGDVAGIHVDDDETIASAIDRLIMGISLVWILDPAGTVTLRQMTFTGPVETLRSDRVARLRTFKPTKTRRVGYQKSYRTHGDGEISVAAESRQILTIREKTETLLPSLAALGARYTQLTDRATVLGLSTTAASTARTALLTTLLGAVSPAHDDVSQDTALLTNLATPLAVWGGTAAFSTSGIYTAMNDTNPADYEERAMTISPAVPGNPYTFGIVVKKDSVVGATRAPIIRLATTLNTTDVRFDTSTGTFTFPLNTAAGGAGVGSGGVGALNDNEWFVWVSRTLVAGETAIAPHIFPAPGTDSAYNPATTGAVWTRDPAVVLGTLDKVGRDALEYRRRDHSATLDALAKAISEADADVAPEVQGASLIVIECDSSGAPVTGALSRFESYKLYQAGVQVTSGITWSRSTPAGVTTAITGAGTGQLEVSAITANEEVLVEISAARSGKSTRRFPVTIRKNLSAPATGGGSGGGTGGTAASQTSGFTAISSGSAAVMSQELQVTVGTGAQVTMSVALAPKAQRASPDGTWKIRCQWERWNGSSWVTQGSTFDTSPDTVVTFVDGTYFSAAGAANSSQTYSSSNGATVKMRLTAWIVSGSSTNTTKSINFTGQIGLQG